MPKNMRGGKHKHAKRGSRYTKDDSLVIASEHVGCMYAVIQKKFGTRWEILCSNGKTERAMIRGKFRSKVWMNIGDIVLVDATELGNFCIVHKYTPDQARQLKSKGEISFDITGNNEQDGIIFEGEGNNSSDEEDELFKQFDAKNNITVTTLEKSKKKSLNDNDELDTNKNNLNKAGQKLNNASDTDTGTDSDTGTNTDTESDSDDNINVLKQKPREDNLVNNDKLLKQFRNKNHGGRGIIRERGIAAARNKKNAS